MVQFSKKIGPGEEFTGWIGLYQSAQSISNNIHPFMLLSYFALKVHRATFVVHSIVVCPAEKGGGSDNCSPAEKLSTNKI